MQCPSIKSPPLWYGSVFFLKRKYNYAFIVTQMKKIKIKIKLSEISSKNFKFF